MPLPPRLPLLYFAAAHVALLLAFTAVALDPRSVAGFFYHDRMVAIVHLVTLGWISFSILGALYMIAPMALRTSLACSSWDYWNFGWTVTGVIGMVAHFWIREYSGMAWSGLMVATGLLFVGLRVARALREARIQPAVKLHIGLAFGNVLLAASGGVLLGFDKVFHFLPGFVLSNVFAHAHLAALGWAVMMVVGVGYRLLPMVLPSAPPNGRSLAWGAWLLEIGTLSLVAGLVFGARWTPACAVLIVGGLAIFFRQVGIMMRTPRPAPQGLVRPDYAVLHSVAALGYLALSAIIGVALTLLPAAEWTLRLATVYGIFGLVGFLAQIVAGMQIRILPVHAWYWAFARTGFQGPVVSPHRMGERLFQQAAFGLWTVGVPALSAGFFFNAVPFLAAGAWSLAGAVLLSGVNGVRVARHGFRNAGPIRPAPAGPRLFQGRTGRKRAAPVTVPGRPAASYRSDGAACGPR